MLKEKLILLKQNILGEAEAFRLHAACLTHQGRVREKNEDNYFADGYFLERAHASEKEAHEIFCDLDSLHTFAVFDGMGGESAGDLASYTAVHSFSEIYRELNGQKMPKEKRVDEALCRVSSDVYQAAKEHKYGLIGSTVSLLMLFGTEAVMADLGDSPVYRLWENSIERISVEHTNARILKEQNIQRKPALTQFLGINPAEFIIEPYIKRFPLKRGETYLICSDGLTDMVTEAEILKILNAQGKNGKEKCEALKEKALENGGVDNITILLIDIL